MRLISQTPDGGETTVNSTDLHLLLGACRAIICKQGLVATPNEQQIVDEIDTFRGAMNAQIDPYLCPEEG